ncbi:MAG: hypothetical protein R3F05_13025 [Planctomycetota bacterium]
MAKLLKDACRVISTGGRLMHEAQPPQLDLRSIQRAERGVTLIAKLLGSSLELGKGSCGHRGTAPQGGNVRPL